MRHTLIVGEDVGLGTRLETARIAADRTSDEMAAAAGISLRSYQRTIAGGRPPRRGELVAWAQLTHQDLEFFEGSSAEGAPILSDQGKRVNRSPA